MHAPLSDQSALPDEDGRLGPADANSRPAKSVTRANRRAPPCGIALAWARPVAGLSSPRHESVDAPLHMPRQVRIDSSRAGDPVPGCQQAGSISEATLPRQGRGLRTAAGSTLSLPVLTMILASTWPRQQRPQAGRGPERPRPRRRLASTISRYRPRFGTPQKHRVPGLWNLPKGQWGCPITDIPGPSCGRMSKHSTQQGGLFDVHISS